MYIPCAKTLLVEVVLCSYIKPLPLSLDHLPDLINAARDEALHVSPATKDVREGAAEGGSCLHSRETDLTCGDMSTNIIIIITATTITYHYQTPSTDDHHHHRHSIASLT